MAAHTSALRPRPRAVACHSNSIHASASARRHIVRSTNFLANAGKGLPCAVGHEAGRQAKISEEQAHTRYRVDASRAEQRRRVNFSSAQLEKGPNLARGNTRSTKRTKGRRQVDRGAQDVKIRRGQGRHRASAWGQRTMAANNPRPRRACAQSTASRSPRQHMLSSSRWWLSSMPNNSCKMSARSRRWSSMSDWLGIFVRVWARPQGYLVSQ